MYLGLELALTGMGTVFAFLILLILVTTFMSWVVNRLEASSSAVNEAGSRAAASAGKAENKAAMPSDMPPELLMAIASAAIHKHRSRNRK